MSEHYKSRRLTVTSQTITIHFLFPCHKAIIHITGGARRSRSLSNNKGTCYSLLKTNVKENVAADSDKDPRQKKHKQGWTANKWSTVGKKRNRNEHKVSSVDNVEYLPPKIKFDLWLCAWVWVGGRGWGIRCWGLHELNPHIYRGCGHYHNPHCTPRHTEIVGMTVAWTTATCVCMLLWVKSPHCFHLICDRTLNHSESGVRVIRRRDWYADWFGRALKIARITRCKIQPVNL